MADYKEVRVERLYLKVPNTDKLRKTAAGRHSHLLASGWREVERKPGFDHVWVRYERTGLTPLKLRLPRGGSEVPRMERRPRGQFQSGGRGGRGGFRGGGRGGGGGGRGAPGAGGARGAPGAGGAGGAPGTGGARDAPGVAPGGDAAGGGGAGAGPAGAGDTGGQAAS